MLGLKLNHVNKRSLQGIIFQPYLTLSFFIKVNLFIISPSCVQHNLNRPDNNTSIINFWQGIVYDTQGWGLLSQFSPFRYFPKFSALSKHTLTVRYRVYIWQVLPQLSCWDTCQIWMWFEESNMYFCEIENFAYGEINEQSFSNPHPKLAPPITELIALLWYDWLLTISNGGFYQFPMNHQYWLL